MLSCYDFILYLQMQVSSSNVHMHPICASGTPA